MTQLQIALKVKTSRVTVAAVAVKLKAGQSLSPSRQGARGRKRLSPQRSDKNLFSGVWKTDVLHLRYCASNGRVVVSHHVLELSDVVYGMLVQVDTTTRLLLPQYLRRSTSVFKHSWTSFLSDRCDDSRFLPQAPWRLGTKIDQLSFYRYGTNFGS